MRKSDGPDYELVRFDPHKIKEHFRVFFVTKVCVCCAAARDKMRPHERLISLPAVLQVRFPDPELVEHCYALEVMPAQAAS